MNCGSNFPTASIVFDSIRILFISSGIRVCDEPSGVNDVPGKQADPPSCPRRAGKKTLKSAVMDHAI